MFTLALNHPIYLAQIGSLRAGPKAPLGTELNTTFTLGYFRLWRKKIVQFCCGCSRYNFEQPLICSRLLDVTFRTTTNVFEVARCYISSNHQFVRGCSMCHIEQPLICSRLLDVSLRTTTNTFECASGCSKCAL